MEKNYEALRRRIMNRITVLIDMIDVEAPIELVDKEIEMLERSVNELCIFARDQASH